MIIPYNIFAFSSLSTEEHFVLWQVLSCDTSILSIIKKLRKKYVMNSYEVKK